MASIFTYDPDPPRVSSPWLTPTDTPKPSTPQPIINRRSITPPLGQLSDYGVCIFSESLYPIDVAGLIDIGLFPNFNVWGVVGQLTHTSFSNLNANTEIF